jgi:hypothetical protein
MNRKVVAFFAVGFAKWAFSIYISFFMGKDTILFIRTIFTLVLLKIVIIVIRLSLQMDHSFPELILSGIKFFEHYLLGGRGAPSFDFLHYGI